MGLKLSVVATLTTRALPVADGASAVVVDIHLTNRGDRDVTGVAVLAPMTIQRVNPGYWPGKRKDKSQPYYCGFQTAIGPRREPPVHENAALFVTAKGSPSLTKLIAPNVGYNTGLVGLRRSVVVKAGETVSLPLVLVAVNSPKDKPIPLTDVMEGLKAEILKKAP